ncbi:hypothetical protein HDU92_008227 [Lobulomyces angularis]|nr:hypothetical protein HDU92_008227 [Lobulomyces angularis]
MSSLQYLFGFDSDDNALDPEIREALEDEGGYLSNFVNTNIIGFPEETESNNDKDYKIKPNENAEDFSNEVELVEEEEDLEPQTQKSNDNEFNFATEPYSFIPVDTEPNSSNLISFIRAKNSVTDNDDYDFDNESSQKFLFEDNLFLEQDDLNEIFDFVPDLPVIKDNTTSEDIQNKFQEEEAKVIISEIPNIMETDIKQEEAKDESNSEKIIEEKVITQKNLNLKNNQEFKKIFPNFRNGKVLKFTDLFCNTLVGVTSETQNKISKPARKIGKRAAVRDSYYINRDDRELFNMKSYNNTGLKPYQHHDGDDFLLNSKEPQTPIKDKIKEDSLKNSSLSNYEFDPLIITDWELNLPTDNKEFLRTQTKNKVGIEKYIPNFELDSGTWDYIYEGDNYRQQENITSNKPDERIYGHHSFKLKLMFEENNRHLLHDQNLNNQHHKPLFNQPKIVHHKQPTDKFNISDDYSYEVLSKKAASRIKQSFGPAKIQHALPALLLNSRYFKTKLSINDLRSFHRPNCKFPKLEDIKFSRVKGKKKDKKNKLKKQFGIGNFDILELMKSGKDISLKDTSKFILLEYSEEQPPLINNVGMTSLIHNYYRKKNENDNYIPTFEHGSHMPLDLVDASPFFDFGDVEKGKTVQTLYNNLFRAPLFRHDVHPTDFLLIRHVADKRTKYFLREIPSIYCVGQTYPMMEVPRPQSRKASNLLKLRVQVASYRLMKLDIYRRLRVEQLVKAFPTLGENKIKQKLKDFAQFQRKGDNTGWWKLKPGTTIPSEDEIRSMVTPEMLCGYESMMVGEQWLRDAGYATKDFTSEKDIADGENESEVGTNGTGNGTSEELEVQLASWVITSNFITTTQTGKGMLRLYGPGDPSGRGEAFSFMKGSLKEMFFRQSVPQEQRIILINEKLNAASKKYSSQEQALAYNEERNRIWKAQWRCLSSKEDIIDEEEENVEDFEDQNVTRLFLLYFMIFFEKQAMEIEQDTEIKQEYQNSSLCITTPQPQTPGNYLQMQEKEDNFDTMSIAESSGSYQLSRNKVLVINRLVGMEWKSEIISDVRLMNAYIRQRTLIERDSRKNEERGTEEEERKKRRKRTLEQLRKLQKNLKRKNKSDGNTYSAGDVKKSKSDSFLGKYEDTAESQTRSLKVVFGNTASAAVK